jgi:hypothetical protein
MRAALVQKCTFCSRRGNEFLSFLCSFRQLNPAKIYPSNTSFSLCAAAFSNSASITVGFTDGSSVAIRQNY